MFGLPRSVTELQHLKVIVDIDLIHYVNLGVLIEPLLELLCDLPQLREKLVSVWHGHTLAILVGHLDPPRPYDIIVHFVAHGE